MTITPFFSIVMPSYLGLYKNSALNRKDKLVRAIQSALNQTFSDFELIIIADGCSDTVKIANSFDDDRLKCHYIDKQTLFSGSVRNAGILESKGKYICYLDSDDYFKGEHLAFLKEQIDKNNNPDFVHFSDNINSGEMAFAKIGTSNICHHNKKEYFWDDGYEHDWRFIQRWFPNGGVFIGKSGYVVCHVPGVMDN
jgi:glycosyltransferase involved in cell wall biosynthesis